jgi:acyl-CoA thioester hydrolase
VSKPFEHPVVCAGATRTPSRTSINHALFRTYLEEGRDAFLTTVMGPNPMYVMARLEIDFERELRIERRQVVVTVSVERVGRTSIVLNEAILDAEGATAASARTTIVAWEPGERRPLPIDDDLRARLLAESRTTRGAPPRSLGAA